MIAGTLSRAFTQRICRIGLFAGTCGVAAGLVTGVDAAWFVGHSLTANGTVVSIRTVPGDGGKSVLYTPVFVFTAKDGKPHTIASDTGSNSPSFWVGRQVPVRYSASQPALAKIATIGQLWGFPLVFGSSGVIFSLMGWLLLRAERRHNPQFKPFGPPRRASQVRQ